MSEGSHPRDARLRSMQTIAGAIIGGAVLFLAVAALMRGDAPIQAVPAESPILTYVLIAIGAILILACQVVPGILTTAGRRKILQSSTGQGDEPLLALYQTQMIIGLALAEGAAFLVIVAYLLEGQPVSLIAGLLFIGFLVAQFPTRRGVEAWLGEQAEWLQRGG